MDNSIGMRRTALAAKKSNVNGISTKRPRTGRARATAKFAAPKFVVCVDNSRYPASLELHKIYRVLPDADAARDGDLRVVDESGEDYLYPADWFVAVKVPHAVESSLLRAS